MERIRYLREQLFRTLSVSGCLKNLHDQREAFQFALQNGKRATRHFHASGGIEGCGLRNSVAAPSQEYLQQFGCFPRIDHAALDQVVSQGA